MSGPNNCEEKKMHDEVTTNLNNQIQLRGKSPLNYFLWSPHLVITSHRYTALNLIPE